MAKTGIDALPEGARKQAERYLGQVRSYMDGREYGVSLADNVRSEAMGRMLSLVAPCLRRFVEAEGSLGMDGKRFVDVPVDGPPCRLILDTDRDGRGETVPALVAGEPRDGYVRRLFEASFHDDGTEKAWASASGRLGEEAETLALLDVLAPRLSRFADDLRPNALTRYSAEVEMVRADGNLIGATCRAYIEALRAQAVVGGLERVARDMPKLAAVQSAEGYVWGERYLAYNDTDMRACAVPLPGAVACLHENVDLCDDLNRWVVAVEPGGRVSVWGYVRGTDDTKAAVDAAVSGGIEAMGPPHVSFDPATGAVETGRDGFDVGTLVSNVCSALGYDMETFADLPEPSDDDDVEARTDFATFTTWGSDFEDEPEGASPSP